MSLRRKHTAMSTVHSIEQAIRQRPAEDLAALRAWFLNPTRGLG